MRVQQEIGGHHDGREHVVEVVRDAAGQLADRLHLLRLRELRLQCALLGRVGGKDDGGFAIRLALLDGGDEEAAEAPGFSRKRDFEGGDVALPVRRLCDRGIERGAVSLGHDGKD